MQNQPPLDGISLLPLIDGKETGHTRGMGFWDYPENGISTPSKQWMAELLASQKAGNPAGDSSRLRLDAGSIKKQYPSDSFPGHAAWLDWPWKLHRIQDENGNIRIELYNLETDSNEQDDVAAGRPQLANKMRAELENWQTSVVQSLNGRDYL
jgi:hypothetical protein